MAVGNNYEIKTKFSYLGVPCLNRYYYRQISVTETPDLDDIKNAWLLSVWPKIQAVTVAENVLAEIELLNLDNPVEFETYVIGGAQGDLLGSPMPSYVTWTFKLNRSTRDFRPGRKAFQGVQESSTDGNDPVASVIPDLADLGDAIAANLVTPVAGATLRPKLLRVAAGSVVIADANVTSAIFSGLSTQSSRKS